MHLSINQKKFDLGIQCIEFLSTLYNGIGVFLVLFPFIKDMGYPRLENYNQLLPLNRFTAALTNDIFLYICGCLTLFTIGIIYNVFVLKRFRQNEALLISEAILSLGFVLLLWFTSLKNISIPAFLIRIFLSVVLYKVLASKDSGAYSNSKILRIIFYGMSLFLCGFFSWVYLIPYYFSKFTFSLLFSCVFLLILALLCEYTQSRAHKFWHWAVDAVVFVLMTILVFKNDYIYFDYAVILGAVNDVLLGKDILANIIISYGYWSIYFIAAVFKIFGVKDYFLGFSLIISVLYFLGYASIYIFLRRYTKNIFFSMAALFLILQINYYYLHIPSHWLPQMTFFRMGSYLPMFFLMFCAQAQDQKRFGWLGIFVAVCSLFWLAEYGVYMIVAFLGVMIFRYLQLKEWRVWGAILLKAGGILFVFLMCITLRIFIKYGHWPVWHDIIYFQILYGQSGLSAIKLDISGWVVPFLIYWIAIYVCFKNYRQIRYADSWLFLSFFGLQSFLYFIVKGDNYDLARASLPTIILAVVGIGFLLQKDIRIEGLFKKIPLKYGLYGLVVFLCILSDNSIEREGRGGSLLSRIQSNPKQFVENRKIPSLVRFLKTEDNYKKFLLDVIAIQKLTDEKEPLMILSKNDTLYYIYSYRKSFFKNSFYAHFFTHSQLLEMATGILESGSKYLFIDNSPFQCFENLVVEHNSKIFSLVSQNYIKRARLGFLDVYEKIQ